MKTLARSLNILLIEDSETDSKLVRLALLNAQQGTQLTAFKTGEEAMAYLRQNKNQELQPDGIILDLNLVGKDGREILFDCKSDPHLKAIPIIIFTSGKFENEARFCKSLGAEYVVMKPMEPDSFMEAVQAIEADFYQMLGISDSTQGKISTPDLRH